MILKKTCCMICMIMPRKRHMQPLCYNTTHARRARFIAFVTASLVASGALIQYIIGETSPLRHSSLRGTRPLSGTCAEYAASVQPTPGELTDLLGYQQKELPEVASNSPVLAASNWEGLANQQHAELPRQQLGDACGWHVFRYRVVSRVVYADHDHKASDVLKGHRETFLEQLLMAVWLYKSFPDVDLWVSFADEPSRCSLDIPVLQYTVIGLNETKQAATTNMVSGSDGSTFSVSMLLTGGSDPDNPTEAPPEFYKGWAFNYPYSWETLSYMPSVLKAYQQCLLDKVGGKPSKPLLIWRGSNTGGRRGWAPLAGHQSQLLQHPWGAALRNKRMSLALLARSHPDIMDVGLHDLIPDLIGPGREDRQLVQDLRDLLIRPFVPQESWGMYALQLSVDGHGSPNRLPLQYLQGSSVILKMMSPYKDSFEELFQPGVHYEPFRYDTSDLVSRTTQLLQQFKHGNKKAMLDMARRTGAKALEVFSIVGQLDALMYAILKVKSVTPWTISQPPLHGSPARAFDLTSAGVSSKKEWHVLRLERKASVKHWRSPTLQASWAATIRQSLLSELAPNFKS